ncbi:NADPH-dependent methylglyoxal reductase GRE2 [Psilocybe cubensis]|uniref:NAD-dependent epimerase/dehydratase domain-containing protein n=2 Tax=Psilocybe cubensis TaxID=181762 RepID=A0A8H7YBJ5_PSICU|nr:NADPH-dependent methylglyoxal reductase GRE2 [Psilocybe cubensis]KAH9487441.1 NADPH-dependent methylglyoxal reductase GRE2 [Psilocybe cubensis]
MPIILPNGNARVLVTGANGYVAAWVVRSLLDQGYIVRGTVRSQNKGEQLKKVFESDGDRFEYVIVDDFTKEGIFDEIVKDVDAIEHVASPVTESNTDTYEDPQIYIGPAVKGTISILKSAFEYGTNVKRVVVTSSLAAILRPLDSPTALDERDWGDEWVKLIEEQGKQAPSVYKYFCSKVLSERAAWEFYNTHKAELQWDLVVINPSHPPLLDFKAVSEVTRSVELWYEYMAKEQPDEILRSSYNYIDVRDLANAHVKSLKREAAGGERIIVSGGRSTWQETRNVLYASKPQYYASGGLLPGKPDIQPEIRAIFNTEKAQRILDIPYKSLEETTLDTLAAFETRGLVV